MSTYDMLGWPVQVSVILVSLAAVLALVPWFGGKEIGPLRVPVLDPAPTQWLRRWGWIGPVVTLALYFPAWPKPAADGAGASFDVDVRFRSSGERALDCGRLAGASVVLTIAQQTPYRTSIKADCTATFAGVPSTNRNHDAVVGIDGARGYVLRDGGALFLEPGRTLTATLDETQAVPRVRIAVLPSRVDAVASQFQQFQEALADKIVQVSETFAARGDAYAYLTQLKVSSEGPLTPSMQEMNDFWNSRHALELVRGQVDPGTQPLTVHSVVYLGDLAPNPQRTAVRLDVRITPADFSRARDSYSVVTLYALARDAQRLKRPPDVVAAFLSEARATALQIDDPANELADIKAAIDETLNSLRAEATP
jgi:hypothetical protein